MIVTYVSAVLDKLNTSTGFAKFIEDAIYDKLILLTPLAQTILKVTSLDLGKVRNPIT